MSFSHTLRRSWRTLLRQLGATGVLVTRGPAGAWAMKEMETGHRRDVYGKLIPRQIIHTFTCTYNGTEVFRADWHPAVAANPYLAFFTVATESGRLRFEWIDDEGTVYATEAEITVV